MNEPTREDIRKVLNRHGYGFQYAVIRRAETLFQEGRSTWALEAAEFPVSGRQGTVHIDLILKARHRRAYLVGECKRADPARAAWCFAKAPYTRRASYEDELVFQQVVYQPANLVSSRVLVKVGSPTSCHLGVELKTSVKGDGTGVGSAINDATAQVLRASNGLIDQIFPGAATQVPEAGSALFVPAIFTTATLWVSHGDLGRADLGTGLLPDDWGTLERVPWLWFSYSQSPALRHQLFSNSAWNGFDISKALHEEYVRTIAVVGPDGLDEFLAWDLATWL